MAGSTVSRRFGYWVLTAPWAIQRPISLRSRNATFDAVQVDGIGADRTGKFSSAVCAQRHQHRVKGHSRCADHTDDRAFDLIDRVRRSNRAAAAQCQTFDLEVNLTGCQINLGAAPERRPR